MERLFHSFDEYFKLLESDDWLMVGDKRYAVQMAFKNAHVVGTAYARLKEDNTHEDFFKKYSERPDSMPNILDYSVLENACDTLLNQIFMRHKSRQHLVQLAVSEYLKINGPENFQKFVNRIVHEQVAVKAITNFLTDSNNYPTLEDKEKVTKELSVQITMKMFKYIPGDQFFKEVFDLLAQDKESVEAMLLLIISPDSEIEELQMKMLNSFLLRAADADTNDKSQNLWKSFIKCDKSTLLQVFAERSWFFEEFFEFIVGTAHQFLCSYDSGVREWQGTSWLTFLDLVHLMQWLWNIEGCISDYVKHSISLNKGYPIWQDLKEKFLS